MCIPTPIWPGGHITVPIEQRWLRHFLPGSHALSLSLAGSGARGAKLDDLSPWMVAEVAVKARCAGVAFGCTHPMAGEIVAAYAEEAHAHGLKTVTVLGLESLPEVGTELLAHLDGVNVELSAVSAAPMIHHSWAALERLCTNVRRLTQATGTWLEVSMALIAGRNDSERSIEALCQSLLRSLGSDVPLHLRIPDVRIGAVELQGANRSSTARTLFRAREQAKLAGVRHVYTENVRDPRGQSTYCAGCGQRVIGRDVFRVTEWHLDEDGHCRACGARLSGVFGSRFGATPLKAAG